ncbi:uncharacterized protein LOC124448447 isoform X1 [Xenia sp. Carnegie-2017]|uniref:uncharacterized protein LOC124448447 isoform X1 n=2 Tax=Xenia sp. Carnegie-2017 TaxID=2897299 RepID=UPI001F038616|nr:uncharacterized protein LOC124448447 isoform X1 [Xenia sp. Carnegie-2017]XP_046855419.1 uncharacterized protein LOC124448447 isoform X1 [Xenia sp. Carnegie-2017]
MSENLFMKILSVVMNFSVDVELVCACVCAANDTILKGQHVPKIYGLGMDVSTGKISPVFEQFQCQIPDETLRHAALYAKKQLVRQVYCSLNREIRITPFEECFPRKTSRIIANLSDEDLLTETFSTSPHCEPANFCTKLREVHQFLVENKNIQETFFPEGNSRRFQCRHGGVWALVLK